MHKLTFPILEQLSDGHFHSGEAIAQQFKVSRATVFNAIKSAVDHGIQIFSVRGKGYKLPHAIQLLSSTAIADTGLITSLQNITEIHPVLDSTNRYLINKIPHLAQQNRIVACNLQTAGRGRRGRQWQAQLGESLTFSVCWHFQCGAAALSGLSLSIGAALIRALHALGYHEAQLKWPNDIVTTEQGKIKKLAGILIELQGDLEGPSVAVIGVGLNLQLSKTLQNNIDQPVTDLASINNGNQALDPNMILTALLHALVPTLTQFETNGFSTDKPFWLAQNAYRNKNLTLIQPDGRQIKGTMHDIGNDGALIVQTSEGIKQFNSGEISLRPA